MINQLKNTVKHFLPRMSQRNTDPFDKMSGLIEWI